MKRVIYLVLLLASCAAPSRVVYEAELGKTRQEIILKHGPADRVESDGGQGEVLVYEWVVQRNVNSSADRTGSFRELRRYRHYFIGEDGRVYLVRWKTSGGDEGEVRK